jgi:hypothetical protein
MLLALGCNGGGGVKPFNADPLAAPETTPKPDPQMPQRVASWTSPSSVVHGHVIEIAGLGIVRIEGDLKRVVPRRRDVLGEVLVVGARF